MPDAPDIQPLTSERWADLEDLFATGDPGWCWCSFLRVPMDQHTREMAPVNRERLATAAASPVAPGLVAYRDGVPVGWVSVGPRTAFPVMGDAGGDASAVWSVSCFVVRRDARRSGISEALLRAAVEHARSHGASAVEGYPVDPTAPGKGATWTGVRSVFETVGFTEAGRFDRWSAVPDATGPAPRKVGKPPGRPVMRLELA